MNNGLHLKMEPVQLIAFPIRSVANSFKLPSGGASFYPFTFTRCSADWSSKDPVLLSEALNCQIENNWEDYIQLLFMCDSPQGFENALYTTTHLDNQDQIVKDYYRSPEQKAEQCAKFLARLKGLFDVFERDQEVFNQTNWNVQTYAIVVLYKGEYFGHIYTWISPVEKWICFAMGIRGRVDSVFSKDNLQNLSGYLLEGARRFALAKGCRAIVVTHPLDVMKSILTKMGFLPFTLEKQYIGRSLGGERVNTFTASTSV